MKTSACLDAAGDFDAALCLTKIALAKTADANRPLRKDALWKVASLAATGAYGDQFVEAGTEDFGAAVAKAVQPERAMLLYSGQLGERPI